MTAQSQAALPVWNLTDLYDGPSSPKLTADLDAAEAAAKTFATAYAGKLSGLDGVGLAKAIGEYEALLDTLYKVASYSQLLHSGDVADAEIGRFYQTVNERVTQVSSVTLFFK